MFLSYFQKSAQKRHDALRRLQAAAKSRILAPTDKKPGRPHKFTMVRAYLNAVFHPAKT